MENESSSAILHLCGREPIRELRDNILRLNGYQVVSAASVAAGLHLFETAFFDLVLIDVEGEGGIPEAEKFCADIKEKSHGQKVAFICNYRISQMTDCPDEIIRSEFNPKLMLEGVRHALGKS